MNSMVKGNMWDMRLSDPVGERGLRNRSMTVQERGQHMAARGITMVIDKGLGRSAFTDFLETASPYVDCIKLGFGTSVLYSDELLLYKTALARHYGIDMMTGGTLLEAAVQLDVVPSYFDTLERLGFNAVEVSDGTIELSRQRRDELIEEGLRRGLRIFTEYGKKVSGSQIELQELVRTAELDMEAGAEMVIIEARESGIDVGLFDQQGCCRHAMLEQINARLPQHRLLWEAPLKSQQVDLITALGSNVHLGNIQPSDAIALEALRRGLRSDTFPKDKAPAAHEAIMYMI